MFWMSSRPSRGEVPVCRRSADPEGFGQLGNWFAGGGQSTQLFLSVRAEFGGLGGGQLSAAA